jgi:hypothetical protein
VPALGGFVAALALMPSRWVLMTVLFVGFSAVAGLVQYASWRRELRRRLAAAPPPPPDVVEVRPTRRRGTAAMRVLPAAALLFAGAGLASALEHVPFAVGLLVAATMVGTGFAADVVELWNVRRWERRNGRILTSLLLGEGEVFYVEQSPHAA